MNPGGSRSYSKNLDSAAFIGSRGRDRQLTAKMKMRIPAPKNFSLVDKVYSEKGLNIDEFESMESESNDGVDFPISAAPPPGSILAPRLNQRGFTVPGKVGPGNNSSALAGNTYLAGKSVPVNNTLMPSKGTFSVPAVPTLDLGATSFSARIGVSNNPPGRLDPKRQSQITPMTPQVGSHAHLSLTCPTAPSIPSTAQLSSRSNIAQKAVPDGLGAVKYPAPNIESFSMDENLGLRYDPYTGLFYDDSVGLFYNCTLKKYLYWDVFKQSYLTYTQPIRTAHNRQSALSVSTSQPVLTPIVTEGSSSSQYFTNTMRSAMETHPGRSLRSRSRSQERRNHSDDKFHQQSLIRSSPTRAAASRKFAPQGSSNSYMHDRDTERSREERPPRTEFHVSDDMNQSTDSHRRGSERRKENTYPLRRGSPRESNMRHSPNRGSQHVRTVLKSPPRRSPMKSSGRRSPHHRSSVNRYDDRSPGYRRSEREQPDHSPMGRVPGRSPVRNVSERSPRRRSPHRQSSGNRYPERRQPVRERSDQSPTRRNPFRSPTRRDQGRSPGRKSPPRRSPESRYAKRSPERRRPEQSSTGRMSSRSPARRMPARSSARSPSRRAPVRSPARKSPQRYPDRSPSRRTQARQTSPRKRSLERRSPMRKSPGRPRSTNREQPPRPELNDSRNDYVGSDGIVTSRRPNPTREGPRQHWDNEDPVTYPSAGKIRRVSQSSAYDPIEIWERSPEGGHADAHGSSYSMKESANEELLENVGYPMKSSSRGRYAEQESGRRSPRSWSSRSGSNRPVRRSISREPPISNEPVRSDRDYGDCGRRRSRERTRNEQYIGSSRGVSPHRSISKEKGSSALHDSRMRSPVEGSQIGFSNTRSRERSPVHLIEDDRNTMSYRSVKSTTDFYEQANDSESRVVIEEDMRDRLRQIRNQNSADSFGLEFSHSQSSLPSRLSPVERVVVMRSPPGRTHEENSRSSSVVTTQERISQISSLEKNYGPPQDRSSVHTPVPRVPSTTNDQSPSRSYERKSPIPIDRSSSPRCVDRRSQERRSPLRSRERRSSLGSGGRRSPMRPQESGFVGRSRDHRSPLGSRERRSPVESRERRSPLRSRNYTSPARLRDRRSPVRWRENRPTDNPRDSRSPGRPRDRRSPVRTREYRSPVRSSDHRSPVRSRDHRSPMRSRDHRSPVRSRDHRSPVRSRDHRSPVRSRDHRSPMRSRDHRSPVRSRDHRSPVRSRDHRSPMRSRDHRSPVRSRDHRSPVRPRDVRRSPLRSQDVRSQRLSPPKSQYSRSPRRLDDRKSPLVPRRSRSRVSQNRRHSKEPSLKASDEDGATSDDRLLIKEEDPGKIPNEVDDTNTNATNKDNSPEYSSRDKFSLECQTSRSETLSPLKLEEVNPDELEVIDQVLDEEITDCQPESVNDNVDDLKDDVANSFGNIEGGSDENSDQQTIQASDVCDADNSAGVSANENEADSEGRLVEKNSQVGSPINMKSPSPDIEGVTLSCPDEKDEHQCEITERPKSSSQEEATLVSGENKLETVAKDKEDDKGGQIDTDTDEKPQFKRGYLNDDICDDRWSIGSNELNYSGSSSPSEHFDQESWTVLDRCSDSEGGDEAVESEENVNESTMDVESETPTGNDKQNLESVLKSGSVDKQVASPGRKESNCRNSSQPRSINRKDDSRSNSRNPRPRSRDSNSRSYSRDHSPRHRRSDAPHPSRSRYSDDRSNRGSSPRSRSRDGARPRSRSPQRRYRDRARLDLQPSSSKDDRRSNPPPPLRQRSPPASRALPGKSATSVLSRFFERNPTNFILVKSDWRGDPQHIKEYLTESLRKNGTDFVKVILSLESECGGPYDHWHIIFHRPEDAVRWYNTHNGNIVLPHKFRSKMLYLYYSLGNWKCPQCSSINFTLRSLCFNCYSHKTGGLSPIKLVSYPTRMVGVYKLSLQTSEMCLVKCLGLRLKYFNIKSVKMLQDRSMHYSSGLCIFDMDSAAQATELFEYLDSHINKVRTFDPNAVISYLTMDPINLSCRAPRSTKPDGSGDVKYPFPDSSTFLYEPTSNMHYDPITKLYYNSSVSLFYNDDLSIYLYYDKVRMTYEKVES